MWVLLAPPNSLVSAPLNPSTSTPKPWCQHPKTLVSTPPNPGISIPSPMPASHQPGAGAGGTAAVTGPAQQPVVPAPIATPGSINERDDEG